MAPRVIPHKHHRIEIDTASLRLGLAMPEPTTFGRNGDPEDERHQLMFPVTAEIYVSTILDRAEFRKHCDTHRTRSAILANLR